MIPSLSILDLVSPVAVKQPKGDLRQYLPYHILSYLILLLPAALDYLGEVPLLAVFHDDVDLGILLVDYSVIVSDYVRVIKLSEYVDLGDQLLLLLLAHLAIVQLLPHHDAAIGLTPDLAHLPEGP